MAINAYLGSTVEEYNEGAMDKLNALDIYCPEHGRKMVLHDHYYRGIKELGVEIRINRLICHDCGKTHAILPDFLQPYKQYSANQIESVLKNDAEKNPDEVEVVNTITKSRWLKTMGAKAMAMASLMSALALETVGRTVSIITYGDMPYVRQILEIAKCLPAIKSSGNALGTACMYLGQRYAWVWSL
jgi:hypothetical protein